MTKRVAPHQTGIPFRECPAFIFHFLRTTKDQKWVVRPKMRLRRLALLSALG
jgi:hypothetical protein